MKNYIQVNKVPPGRAPEEIRQAWVGVILPLMTEQDRIDIGNTTRFDFENKDGYEVLTSEAIKALRDEGKEDAVNYWSNMQAQLGKVLIFKKECCGNLAEASLSGEASMQIAIMLDELPSPVLDLINEDQEDIEKIKEHLSSVDLSGYYTTINDPKLQRAHAAVSIYIFLKDKKKEVEV